MINFSERQIEIIKITGNIITNQGLKDLTIKNIAKKLNVTEPAIYRHFESKEELLMGVLEYFQNIIETNMNDINDTVVSLNKIEYIFTKRFETFKDNPEFPLIIFCEEVLKDEKILSEKVMKIVKLQKETLNTIVKNGQSANEIRDDLSSEQISEIIIGTIGNAVREWIMTNRNFDIIKKGKIILESIKKLIKK